MNQIKNNIHSGFTRFLEAQDSGDFGITFEEAMRRLKDGEELTEGLWYIFPTVKDFGNTENDKKFGLSSLYEACEYWAVPELRDRLKEVTVALIQNGNGRSAEQILGKEGSLRLQSCITLFDMVDPGVMFEEANDVYFAGKWCKEIAMPLKKDWHDIHNNVWIKYKSKFKDRAFFDLSCHETKTGPDGKRITDEERYATFVDLVKRGYNIYKLAWNYLALRYWLGDKEREEYTSDALLRTYETLRKDIREWMDENHYDTVLLDSLFPDMESEIYSKEVSWGEAAFRLDALSGFAAAYPALSAFTENVIKEHSQLTYMD